MTLIELLVASMMSVILVGATGAMLISAVRTQPQVSEKAQNVTTARYVMERMTREIRNGVRVDEATAAQVSFVSKVRRTACGGATVPSSAVPARECQITYDCTGGDACTRTEAEKGDMVGGTTTALIDGLGGSEVFNFYPNAAEATYIGVTVRVPNPSGSGLLTISDGASLRTPTLLTSG